MTGKNEWKEIEYLEGDKYLEGMLMREKVNNGTIKE